MSVLSVAATLLTTSDVAVFETSSMATRSEDRGRARAR
jgi:hypothetical protein